MKITAFLPGAAAIAAVVAASLVTLPSTESGVEVEPVTVEVVPADQPAVCPGPLEIPVGETESGDEDLDSGSDDRELWTAPADSTALGEGVALTTPLGASLERVGSGDIASLAGLTCTYPRQEQWIVAGSTALGSSARLVLSNPSAVAVRVSVRLYGPLLFDEGQTITTAVGPGSQTDVLIESVEPEIPGLVLQVTAGGVGIVAALQDSRLDGFTSAGTEWATGSAYAESTVVPMAGPSTAEDPAVLRLLATEDTSANLTLLGPDGEREWLGDQSVQLEAGLLTDITVPEGDIAGIGIDADVPVAAAVMTQSSYEVRDGEDTAADIAWTPSQDLSTPVEGAVIVPEGNVTVVAAAVTNGRLLLTDPDGDVVADEWISPLSATEVEIDVPAGTQITGSGSVAWALRVRDDGFVTSMTPRAPERLPEDVDVVSGSYVDTEN
ncbi:DUF5719 family protein [Demequina sediminicola]|uniref:DUF5719 family protein n=1 Tax=Demequina sediminicola TaxID=1095026 RepID=UPI0007822B03|nr:DUF5719 family protein [Demequina sediminicola]